MVHPQHIKLASIDHFWTTTACNGSVSWYVRYHPNQLGGPTKTKRLSKNAASSLVAYNVPMSERRSTTQCRAKPTKATKASARKTKKGAKKKPFFEDNGRNDTCSNTTVLQCKSSCYLVSVLLMISKLPSVKEKLDKETQHYVNQVNVCPNRKMVGDVCEMIPSPIRVLYQKVYSFYKKTLLDGGSAELLLACILKANNIPFVFVGESSNETARLEGIGVPIETPEGLSLTCVAQDYDIESPSLGDCMTSFLNRIPPLVAPIKEYVVLSVDLRDEDEGLVVPMIQAMELLKLLASKIKRMRGGLITVEKKSKKAPHGVHEVSFTVCRENNGINIIICNMWYNTSKCQNDILHSGLGLRNYHFCINVCCFIDKK
jgi:hypothetical protein